MIVLGILCLVMWGLLFGLYSGSETGFICRGALLITMLICILVGPIALTYGGAMESRSRTRARLPLDGSSEGQWEGVEIAINRVLTAVGLWRSEDMFDKRWNPVSSRKEASFIKFELPDDLSIILFRTPPRRGSLVTVEISGIAPHNTWKAKKVQAILDALPFHDDKKDR